MKYLTITVTLLFSLLLFAALSNTDSNRSIASVESDSPTFKIQKSLIW